MGVQVEAEEAPGREKKADMHNISDCIAPERDSQPALVSDNDLIPAIGSL